MNLVYLVFLLASICDTNEANMVKKLQKIGVDVSAAALTAAGVPVVGGLLTT